MDAPSHTENSSPCDCHDEQHKKNVNHRHIGDECVREDGTRHKLHQR